MLSFLGSEIGRGHPFYLDGVRRALRAGGRDDLIARETDVFAVSRGLSAAAWRAVRASYRVAGRGGAVAALYHRARGTVDYDRGSGLLRLLGRDLRRWAEGVTDGPIVVDHPAVVGALAGRADVWYVHGELVAPREAIVRGAAGVLVPTDDVAEAFAAGGVAPERVHVTGLCPENELVPGADGMAVARIERLRRGGPRTLGLFSSGAEPGAHVATLAEAARAAVRTGHTVLAVAARGGRLARAVRREAGPLRGESALLEVEGREDLDRTTAEIFPRLDVVLSPPHERSQWALGLGVPFLLVGPDVGPFAPRNRALLLARGVAMELADPDAAERLPEILAELDARGLLVRMAENGRGRPIDGFRRAAEILIRAGEGGA